MKIFTGKVVSTKMAKTATIVVTRFVSHSVYKKGIKRSRKYQVHDEYGVKVGDLVKFVASKPYSKNKKWAILKDEKVTKKEVVTKPVTKEKVTKNKKTK